MTDDAHIPGYDVVELATLVLPSHAADTGLEVGDGDEVVLEALQETVDNIAYSQLSAVVDLEILSDLVGISEEEFIADLHMELAEHRQFEEDLSSTSGAVGAMGAIGAGTGTGTGIGIGIVKQAEAAASAAEEAEAEAEANEEQHLLAQPQPQPQPTSDRVTLSADAFIESLVDVLHMPTIAEGKHYKQEVVISTDAGSDGHETQQAAATKTDGDQHLGHDAFLLNIPNTDSLGDLHDHFVLAMPEIRVDDSIAASTISHASVPMMERAMSFLPDTRLPTDVIDVQLEAHTHLPTKEDPTVLHLDLVVKRQVPIIGYVILISGLVALASVGAALDLQKGPSPTMKTLWRQLATCVALSPLVAKSLYYDGFPQLTLHQWMLLPVCGMAYAYMCTAFVVALAMTTLANAFVLSNMTSLVIIVGRFVLGLPVLPLEGLGATMGFTGAAICANDASKSIARLAANGTNGTNADRTNDTTNTAMLGNAVALSASFGTAVYLIFAKSLRSSLDVFVFMFNVMLLGSISLIAFMIVSGENFTWGMDPDIGMFGWLNWTFDRLPLEIFMAVVCNCLGTTGYIAVMKYFEPIVPASAMLMEPVVGALLGALAGTAPLPGLQTWGGNAVVAAGTFVVIWSGSKKTDKIDATEALRPSSGNDDDASTVVSLMKSPLIRKPSLQDRKVDDAPTRVVWDS